MPDSFELFWLFSHPCFVENQPELLVPLEARSDPRTLSREIVSTETHSVPQPCTWGSNQCTRGDRSRSSHLLTCKTFYKYRVFLYLTVEKVESASLFRLHPSTATIADFTVGEHNHRLWEKDKQGAMFSHLVVAVHSSIHSDVCRDCIRLDQGNWERPTREDAEVHEQSETSTLDASARAAQFRVLAFKVQQRLGEV